MKALIALIYLVAATFARSIDTRQTTQTSALDDSNSAKVTFYTTIGSASNPVPARSPLDNKERSIGDLTSVAPNRQSNRVLRNGASGMSCTIYGPAGEVLAVVQDGMEDQSLSPSQANYATASLEIACIRV
ncbi:hypothetical protein N7533_001479 [Penicillium manginii]|jgi:hypothetical protein|uniref:uncharacterized protein n=1 Tax=Penicillium manginii TaxID=203109 RepID=UPI0025487EC1|nr:uncharacterized protein N7533_001479 [Penicillium manginii]KAJ5762798.1 hypothetical protein N7533_001479 [Penicillium manginii]